MGPGSEEKRSGDSHAQKGEWDSRANEMVQQFTETGPLGFKSINVLSRGILKQRKGESTIHFNGDSTNTELSLETIHSVNQLSVYGAVANWCHQLGLTEEEKGRANFSVHNMSLFLVHFFFISLHVNTALILLSIRSLESQHHKMFTSLQPAEVQLLVSPPTMALGNRMRENVFFEALTCREYSSHNCQKTYFQFRVTAGKKYKIRLDGDDGWESVITLPCLDFHIFSVFLDSQVVAAVPEDTIIGPILKFKL